MSSSLETLRISEYDNFKHIIAMNNTFQRSKKWRSLKLALAGRLPVLLPRPLLLQNFTYLTSAHPVDKSMGDTTVLKIYSRKV
jgi:hypothetical protein